MAGLEVPQPPVDPETTGHYSAVPASDRPGCLWVVLDSPSRSKQVGYLEPVEDGTLRAFYGGCDGDRLGRVGTVAGGVHLVTLYHRSKLVVDWCRTWGHLDAVHDRAEDLTGWG